MEFILMSLPIYGGGLMLTVWITRKFTSKRHERKVQQMLRRLCEAEINENFAQAVDDYVQLRHRGGVAA